MESQINIIKILNQGIFSKFTLIFTYYHKINILNILANGEKYFYILLN